MISFLSDALIIACPVLMVVGIFLKNSESYKNHRLGKKLIIAGIASLFLGFAIAVIFDWNSLVEAFNRGAEAASDNNL